MMKGYIVCHSLTTTNLSPSFVNMVVWSMKTIIISNHEETRIDNLFFVANTIIVITTALAVIAKFFIGNNKQSVIARTKTKMLF